MGYYNTTKLEGEDLKKAKHNALAQRQKILDLFINKRTWMIPDEVHLELFKSRVLVPISNTRRAITDLTNEGYLIKGDISDKKSYYNKPVHEWKWSGKKTGGK